MLPRLQASPTKRRVATYMAGFEGIDPLEVIKVAPPHQPGAKWPVFLFELGGGSSDGGSAKKGIGQDKSQTEAIGSTSSTSSGNNGEGSNGIKRYGSKWVAGNGLTSLTSYLRCGSNFQWTVGALLIAAATTSIFHRWNVKSWPIFLRSKSEIR